MRTLVLLALLVSTAPALATTDGAISGTVFDDQGIALPNAQVTLVTADGATVKTTTSSATGTYQFFPVTFGTYNLEAQAQGFAKISTAVDVASGGTTALDLRLKPAPSSELTSSGNELVLEVKAKKHLIQSTAATSSTEISHQQIAELPSGDETTLPKLMTSTAPGAVPGPFGQVFFRGNHANIQYQIDGVQLPDSPSNTFGQAFSPRNIDHMEVITGGVPAEYGQRLAAVVNIVTKSGPEEPGGEAEVSYGSYNTTQPHLIFGGSNASGSLHYFLSGNFSYTDRGLDTPQPASESNQYQGGTDATHDQAMSGGAFARFDWLAGNHDKLSFIFFDANTYNQIPNYPSTFAPTDAYFKPNFPDVFGNGDPSSPTFLYTPSTTNDWQFGLDSYVEAVWKHTLSDRSFLQIAPYYKVSYIKFQNDPTNDLVTASDGADAISGSSPASFFEDRIAHNLGLKGDWSYRLSAGLEQLVKAGFQLQASQSRGTISVQTTNAGAPTVDTNPDTGYFESLYAQDDVTLLKPLVLNVGLRFDSTQFLFANANPVDWYLQPRVGLNLMVTPTTKLHAFYGKLFQPSPVEDLRVAFGGTDLTPYDVKAEKDDYFEVGVAQQFLNAQVFSLNVYYKNATDMLDDAELFNTSIAQPYNFLQGYAYGAEFSLRGEIAAGLSEWANYSFEVAKGKGLDGGVFAQPPPDNQSYQFLDHVQLHTINGGLTFSRWGFWATAEELIGSGLRTGPDNSLVLPWHYETDLTVGYQFAFNDWFGKVPAWASRWKLSVDLTNLFNDIYPITVANGFNGSHYAPGRQLFVRLSKEI